MSVLTKDEPQITFLIHDLNHWGGQDRSTFEIARHISHKFHVDLMAYNIESTPQEKWGQFSKNLIKPEIKRPALIRFFSYYFLTLPKLLKKRRSKTDLLHATGACSLINDVIQVQFVHKTWSNLSPQKNPYRRFLQKFNVFFENLVFKKSKQYIAIAHCIKKELIEGFGIPEDNIRVIHHGVDIDTFHPFTNSQKAKETRAEIRTELGLKEDDIALLTVGAYNDRKGLPALIRAMKSLEKNKNLYMVAVGGGSPEKYKQQAKKLGVESQVRFVTHKKDITPYYWAADLFVLPSLYEPFGLVTLEAMSCGLPTIISASAGSSELVINGENGFQLQAPESEDEIASYVEKILDSSDKRIALGKAARKTAEAHSWKEVSHQYGQVFEQLIK